MHSRATRQGQLRRVLRFLVLLAVFVALNVTYILVMFAYRYATVEGKSDFGNGGNLTAGFEGVEMPHRPGAAVSYAAHLLLLLETYLGKGSGGLLRGSDTWTPAFPSNATPHSVLSGYYSEGLPKLNSRLERRLDGGSMMDGVHSDSFWSTPHIVRRGYGLEGSIFVALMHREVPSSRERRPVQFESRCAMTIYDMYETAQWPVAIFTGIVEVVHDAVSGKEPKGRDGEGSPRWRALPPSRCLPAAYQSHSCAQRRGFCPRDNIRLRQIRGPTKSESEKRARGMKEKGGRSQRVDGNGYNGGSKGQTSDSDGEDNYRRDFTSSAAHRYATLSLYRGETYVLFLNDGLLLVPSWDVKTRLMLLQLPSRYPVLTQKANIIARGIVRQAWKGSVLCNATITSSNNGKAAEDMDTYNCDPNQKRKRDKSTDTSKRAPLRSRLDHGCAAGTLDLNSGSDNGQCSRGLWEEDVVEFLFRLPSDDVETSGSYGVDDHMDEAEPVSPKTVGDHPSFRQSRQPNRIQLYWMRKLRETLRTELKKRMSEWDTTTFICGVMVKVLDELRVKNVCTEGNRHCGAGMGNTSSSEEGGGILRLRTNSVRRLSDTLHDPQYMHPSPLHRCGDEWLDATCLDTGEQNSPRQFPPQPWLSTDFLFTRAEAFFNLSETGTHGRRRRVAEGKEGVGYVPLDPYLGLLTPDEEAVLLAARLWTHGWDLYAATEPIVFAASNRSSTAYSNRSAKAPSVASDAKWRMRQRSLSRLRFILFGELISEEGMGDNKAEVLKFIERYGLGSQRSWESFLQHVGLEQDLGGEVGSGATEQDKTDGEWRHYMKACDGI